MYKCLEISETSSGVQSSLIETWLRNSEFPSLSKIVFRFKGGVYLEAAGVLRGVNGSNENPGQYSNIGELSINIRSYRKITRLELPQALHY